VEKNKEVLLQWKCPMVSSVYGLRSIKDPFLCNFLHYSHVKDLKGICLEKLSGPFEKDTPTIVFKKGLAYGSWYNVLIRISNSENQQSYYMKKGIYLKKNKFIQLSDILQEENDIDRKNKPKWQCKNKSCEEWNEGGVKMCLHCYTNRNRRIIRGLSYIPVLGIPFSVTHATLESGRAAHTKERHDKISAGLAIGTAAAEIVLAPILVSSIVHIPAKVAVQTGTHLTANTLFTNTGHVAAGMTAHKVLTAVKLKSAAVTTTEKIYEASKLTKKTN
jgi:hypothetical protein